MHKRSEYTRFLEKIASDNSLTREQKTLLAKGIAYGYFIKTRIKEITVNTRTTKQECLDAFNKKMRFNYRFTIVDLINPTTNLLAKQFKIYNLYIQKFCNQ